MSYPVLNPILPNHPQYRIEQKHFLRPIMKMQMVTLAPLFHTHLELPVLFLSLAQNDSDRLAALLCNLRAYHDYEFAQEVTSNVISCCLQSCEIPSDFILGLD